MKAFVKVALGSALLVAAGGLSAGELVVSKFEKGGVTFLSFDLIDVRDVYGVQFKINAPGLADADLSKCVTGLGSDFNAVCRVTDGVVTVAGYTGEAKNALSGKSVPIGQISFKNQAKSEITVTAALTANAAGEDSALGVSLQ